MSRGKIRYYWCVNCGHSEDFGFHRTRGLKCTSCGYDDIKTISAGEFKREEKIRQEIRQLEYEQRMAKTIQLLKRGV